MNTEPYETYRQKFRNESISNKTKAFFKPASDPRKD